jgi:hypothetical protein
MTSYLYTLAGRTRAGRYKIVYGTSRLREDPVMMLTGCTAEPYARSFTDSMPRDSPFCSRIISYGPSQLFDIDMVELSRHPGIGSFVELVLRPILREMRDNRRSANDYPAIFDMIHNIGHSHLHNNICFNVTSEGKITILVTGKFGEHAAIKRLFEQDRNCRIDIELSPTFTGRDGEKIVSRIKRFVIGKSKLRRLLENSMVVPRHVIELYVRPVYGENIRFTRLRLQNDPLATGIMFLLDDGLYNFPLLTAGKCITLRHMVEDTAYAGGAIPIEGHSRAAIDMFIDYDAGYKYSEHITPEKLTGILNFADFIGYMRLRELVNDVIEEALKLPDTSFDRFVGDKSIDGKVVAKGFTGESTDESDDGEPARRVFDGETDEKADKREAKMIARFCNVFTLDVDPRLKLSDSDGPA